jgi:hypothetical protein
MKAIKKLVLIVLCVQITLPSDLLHDIVCLPLLFSHFAHHNHHHDSVSFTDFVAQHYQENDLHHDHEDEDHENLPFHHHDQLTVSQTIIAFSEIKHFQFTPVYFENPVLSIIYHQEFYPSGCSSSIWRPPKLV